MAGLRSSPFPSPLPSPLSLSALPRLPLLPSLPHPVPYPAQAFLQTNTINLREYIICLTELGFIKSDEHLKVTMTRHEG